VLIAEEGYPIYEELLKGYFGNAKFRGRLDGALPRAGELSPDALASALGVPRPETKTIPKVVANRPPMLCQGCGHGDLYVAMNKVFELYPAKHVFSDIGCYTLGALPPYDAISTCVDMGASITMAKGASDAGLHPAVAVIGDSTFTHSGITGLIDAVNDGTAITVIISDNATVAMTGGQESSGDGNLVDICKGVGVDEAHIRVIEPLRKNLQNTIAVLKEEFEYKGVSVVIAQRECVQVAVKNKKTRNKQAAASKPTV
jgi:indolepyruvate ferredoxin oxidoreductase alpha subunit